MGGAGIGAATSSGSADATLPVPAVDNALRMLTFLAGQRGPVPAAVIARSLGLPRSSTYHILSVMIERGFVAHLREQRAYGLGIAAFELSSGYLRQQPLARIGAPLLAELVDRVGESAHLAVLHGGHVLYIVESRAKHRPALVTDVGVRLPCDLTASGRAMLACLPPRQLRALFPVPSAFSTSRSGDRSPAPYAALKAVLASVRFDGFAREDGDVTEGLASVALPVVDHTGWPAAAVAVTFPRERLTSADWKEWAAVVRPVSEELTRRIGGKRQPFDGGGSVSLEHG